MSLIQVWKTQIRRTLIDVKKDFNEWIDTFTNKFVKSLNKIEHSKELSEFAYFDKHLTGEVLKLQDEYKNILSIYEKIANAPANEKIEMYETKTKEMREIEQRVISRNKEIKSKAAKLSKLLRETVELDGLGLKVF
jgi:cysteinyl-tRNA synthetase